MRAIKAQALEDFIIECTNPVSEQDDEELKVDDSSTKTWCGADMLIKPPTGEKMEYAIKFEFLGSNNEVKYEVLILGIQSGSWQEPYMLKQNPTQDL